VDLISGLLLLFVVARLAGEGMERIRQSPMLGEVFAGILVGPMLLGVISPNPSTPLGASLGVVATLGIFVLVLLAGIELGREGLHQAVRERSIVVAYVEFVLPFAMGYALGAVLRMDVAHSLFLATAMAVTALPVSVRILMDLNLLHSRLGRAIVSVALVNDLVAFALLGLVVAFMQFNGNLQATTAGFLALKIFLFVVLILCVGVVLKRVSRLRGDGASLMQKGLGKLRSQESAFALCVSLALALGTAAELVGIHFAVGVFYAGVLMTPQLLGWREFNQVRRSMSAVSFGLLTPIFFAYIGLQFTFTLSAWPLIAAITTIAFAGKLAGGILGGLMAGFRRAPLIALGVGLNARGMMELVLAQVGLATGIIDAQIYSALVVMTLVTTFCTPPLLKALIRRFKVEDVLPVGAKSPIVDGDSTSDITGTTIERQV
jgi:Na+:H+ antiporter